MQNLIECLLQKQKKQQQHTTCNKMRSIHKSARKGTFIPTWLIFVFSVFKIPIICKNIFQFLSLSIIQNAICVNYFSIFNNSVVNCSLNPVLSGFSSNLLHTDLLTSSNKIGTPVIIQAVWILYFSSAQTFIFICFSGPLK